MCGFVGLLSTSKQKQENFAQAVDAIKARGTSHDSYQKSGEQYGYSRLPTDDVQNEKLGHIDTTANKLFFNGLITNVDYLANTFGLPATAKRSDAGCLRAGLSKQGPDFLKRARGMFALAFVTDTSVTLVRDTVGIKPLYYAFEDGSFAFGSELKALAPLADTVHEVLPGQIVVYDKSSCVVTKRTYSYESYKHYASNELEDCLREAVVEPAQRYLQDSDKRLALLLSGGLDSSITASLLVRSLSVAHAKRLVAFCIGEDAAPDVQTAKRLAKDLHIRLIHVRPYNPQASLQTLPRIVYDSESPYARVIKVALLYDTLAVAIKRHNIDVVVGGEGADELFFGYHRFIDGLDYAQSKELFHIFFKKVFHYTLLQRYDRIMARHQIEGRVPYLDQELIELAANIPPEEKVRYHPAGHISKLPLRALAKQLGLPMYIYDRPKEKMTAGATGQQNSTTQTGYLECEATNATGLRFQHLVQTLYRLHFGNILAHEEDYYTEERAMQLVVHYRTTNQTKQLERNYL